MSANQPKSSGKVGLVMVVLVLVIAVVAVAWYWEPISYFTKLRMWDKEAPGRVVLQFLDAGSRGDEKTADGLLGTKDLKPLVKQGKWRGYQMTTLAGTIEYYFADLTP